LPHQDRNSDQIALIPRGGYVLRDVDGTPDLLLIATGSEVKLVVAAAEALAAEGVKARVVSMPCTELFDSQDEAYREQVLPAAVSARVVVEAGVTATWWRYAGSGGRIVGLDQYGASAPADILFEHFGFSTDNVIKVARESLAANQTQ